MYPRPVAATFFAIFFATALVARFAIVLATRAAAFLTIFPTTAPAR